MRTIIALLFAAVALHAQTPAQPYAPAPQQFFTNNGVPLALGTVTTYVAGTSTPVATCRDSQCSSMNANPIVLDAAGRANIFLAAGQGYKFVVADLNSVVISTTDGIVAANTNLSLPLAGGTITGNLTVTGSTVFNGPTVFGGACSGTPCLWTNLNNTIFLANSTQTVSPLKIQNQAVSGDTLLSLQASSTQAGNLLSVFDNSGTLQGSIDKSFNWNGDAFQGIGSQFSLNTQNGGTLSLTAGGRINWTTGSNITSAPSLGFAQNGPFSAIEVNNGIPSQAGGSLANFLAANATVSGAVVSTLSPGLSISFQISNSLGTPFQVDSQGDISGNGHINMLGATAGGAAYSVNGNTVIDNGQNATFNNITINGTCSGSGCPGGGGGGGGLPVSDTTIITKNSSDATKQMKFDNSGIPTATTVSLKVPSQNGTISTLENNQTVSGNNTFTNIVAGTAGFSGLAFSGTGAATASGAGQNTFQLANNNFFIDSNGNMTAACAATCTAGTNGANWITNGYIVSHTWFGMQTTNATPPTVPGTGFSAFTYKGGVGCGLCFWAYDTQASSWTSVNFGVVGAPGLTGINAQTGPTVTLQAAAGTGQVLVTNGTPTNTITLTLPQPLAVSNNVGFGSLTAGCGGSGSSTGTIQSCATGATPSFQTSNSLFIVDGSGDITASGQLNLGSGIASGNPVFYIQSVAVADTSRNFTVNHLTVNGGCTGCGTAGGGITSVNSQTGPTITIAAGNPTLTVSAAGNVITLGTQQALTTSSGPTFASETITGALSAGGAISTNGGLNVSNVSTNSIQTTGGISATGGLAVGITNFNSIQTVGGINLCTAGSCGGGQAITINGVARASSTGYWLGPINTTGSPSSIVNINGTGSTGAFYGNAVPGSSTGFNCVGVSNGWEGYSITDGYIVVCLSGTRFRVQLTAF